MKGDPLTKDFKILLLKILQKNSINDIDRDSIESYLYTYFGGRVVELEPLTDEELEELKSYNRNKKK